VAPGSLCRQAYAPAVDRIVHVVIGVVVAAAVSVAICAPVTVSEAATVPGASATAAGSIGVQLLEAPLASASDPRARLYIIDHLHPGAVIHRRIEISNTTASTVHVLLYPAAAAISQGEFVGAAAHSPNELSTWTSVLPGAADVPPGGHTIASVTIAIPHGAPPGEQYGVVWAETRSAPAGGAGITQVSRVGIRLYVSVGPGGAPASAFTIGSLIAKRSSRGQPVVVATVHNSGGRALDINGTLQLSGGPGGLSAGPFPANLGTTLAIGATEPIVIQLDKRIPAGPWHALVRIRSGLLERSARATLTFPATGGSSTPYLVIVVLVILVLVGIVLARLRTRRPRNGQTISGPSRAVGSVHERERSLHG
jgi:LPXTG-motif cell wall-anchored protein